MEYIPGIGTFDLIDKVLGGATGRGISSNIRRAYTFLVNNYCPGDQIYVFGFSRGAYTARSLSGLIDAQGLLRKDKLHEFYWAYRQYRIPDSSRSTFYREKLEDIVDHDKNDPESGKVPVHFLGVWDTVGCLGVPIPLLRWTTKRWVSFHDTTLAPNVSHAYQALALHEFRTLFKPDLWTEKLCHQKMEQVWFTGSHSDIGGGLKNQQLSDISWNWMLQRAESVGLELDWTYINKESNCDYTKPIYVSRRKWYRIFRPYIRPTAKPEGLCEFRHQSVEDRLGKLKDQQRNYKRWTVFGFISDPFRLADERSMKLRSLTL